MTSVRDATEKPSIKDFKLGRQLGEGNFSRIVVAIHIASGEEFALKIIEKQRIKRLKVRHPNIFNEINMEKEVLNKLHHPNIIRLYQTFQDDSHLYFLLELLKGGELLQQLVHDGSQVGVQEDLARFYLIDIITAVEFMHDNGVIHRDLKPENMVISERDGHLKLIDFGTAKDLLNPALNGPNFVGTPEYMPPEAVDNKETTPAGDVWAIGCIAFQLLLGDTPFSGGSVYLTLLKVQAGAYTLPSFLSESAKDLIRSCLNPVPGARPTIKDIKEHPFFHNTRFQDHVNSPRPKSQFADDSLFQLISDLRDADNMRTRLKPLEFRDGTDSVQPKIDNLTDQGRAQLMHLLERKRLLHLTSVYPRFFETSSLGRCAHARNGEYVGLTHSLQNEWKDNFKFMMLAGPCLSTQPGDWESNTAEFRQHVIEPINSVSPAFVIFCGDLSGVSANSGDYREKSAACQDLLNEIHPEVKLVFVPGVKTFSPSACDTARANYAARFGDDYFSFWYGGVKFVVFNSCLAAQEQNFTMASKQQDEWLARELENGKLCARDTVVLSAHSFHSLVQGPERPPHLMLNTETNQLQEEGVSLSVSQKRRYVELLSKFPPRLIITSDGPENRVITVQTAMVNSTSTDEADETAAIKKTEMVVCSPQNQGRVTDTMIHLATVSQSGIKVTQLTPSSIVASKNGEVSDPEDMVLPLSLSSAKVAVSRDASTI